MAIIRNFINTGEGVERSEPSYTPHWWEGKLVQPLGRTIWKFLKLEFPYDSIIPFLAMYPEKYMIQKDTCIPMFTAALFTIAKT